MHCYIGSVINLIFAGLKGGGRNKSLFFVLKLLLCLWCARCPFWQGANRLLKYRIIRFVFFPFFDFQLVAWPFQVFRCVLLELMVAIQHIYSKR